ncbi:hypothetical protein ACFYVL_10285 [Streptomyces sp. NPDC004111]|uniref:hypothetical protein n=1 Tax=Streptomyces sp. NPDC004111 TaxID=3364690 RepID=UPI0036AF1250
MGNGPRVAAYALVLAVTFGGAYGIGSAIDPVVATEEKPAKAPGEAPPGAPGEGGGPHGGKSADHGAHGGDARGALGN